MALDCIIALSKTNWTVGSNLGPKAFLTCNNATAAAISVTGIQMELTQRGAKMILPGSVAAIGAGSTVIVPALSAIKIGPIDLAIPSVGVQDSGNLMSAQIADPLVMVGATVYGSDGSINLAGAAPLQLRSIRQPAAATRGGFLNMAEGSNAATGDAAGVL